MATVTIRFENKVPRLLHIPAGDFQPLDIPPGVHSFTFDLDEDQDKVRYAKVVETLNSNKVVKGWRDRGELLFDDVAPAAPVVPPADPNAGSGATGSASTDPADGKPEGKDSKGKSKS